MVANNDRTNLNVAGATAEVAILKEAVSKAENSAALERTEREKHEARVAEVWQELQALVENHESLERDSKTRESELASARESAKAAKTEAQKALQEIEAMKKIAAGKAFFMQSKARESELLVTYPSPELSRSIRRSAPQCVLRRRILSGRGRELDGKGVLVSIC